MEHASVATLRQRRGRKLRRARQVCTNMEHAGVATFRQCGCRKFRRTRQVCTALEHASVATLRQRRGRKLRRARQVCTNTEHAVVATFRQRRGRQKQFRAGLVRYTTIIFKKLTEGVALFKLDVTCKTLALYKAHYVAVNIAILIARYVAVFAIFGVSRVVTVKGHLVAHSAKSYCRSRFARNCLRSSAVHLVSYGSCGHVLKGHFCVGFNGFQRQGNFQRLHCRKRCLHRDILRGHRKLVFFPVQKRACSNLMSVGILDGHGLKLISVFSRQINRHRVSVIGRGLVGANASVFRFFNRY